MPVCVDSERIETSTPAKRTIAVSSTIAEETPDLQAEPLREIAEPLDQALHEHVLLEPRAEVRDALLHLADDPEVDVVEPELLHDRAVDGADLRDERVDRPPPASVEVPR